MGQRPSVLAHRALSCYLFQITPRMSFLSLTFHCRFFVYAVFKVHLRKCFAARRKLVSVSMPEGICIACLHATERILPRGADVSHTPGCFPSHQNTGPFQHSDHWLNQLSQHFPADVGWRASVGARSISSAFPPAFFFWGSGSRLLSHTVSSAVPSAVYGLTFVFGMGTGVSHRRIATRNFRYLLGNSTVKHISSTASSSLERR